MTTKLPSIRIDRNHARATKGPRPDGRYYWQARRFTGGTPRETTSALGWLTEEEAWRELAQRVGKGSIFPAPPPVPELRQQTVQDLLELYMGARLKAPLSPLTKANNQTAANRVADAIGTVVVAQLSIDVLEEYVNTAKGRSSTIKLDVRVLRQAWRWGISRGLLDRPWPRIKVLDRGDSRPKTAAPLEAVEAVERAMAKAWPEGWPWRLFHLLAVTGARISELARLTVGDVDLEAGVVRIRGKHTPGKVPYRDFPLLADTVEMLREWVTMRQAESPGYLSPKAQATETGAPWELSGLGTLPLWGPSPKTVANRLRDVHIPKAEEATKTAHLTPYDLRRAAARRFRDLGVPIKVAATLLGNSPKTLLTYYELVTDGDLREAVEIARPGRAARGQVINLNRREP